MDKASSLKVLHINTSDTQGGAARAAYRLHRSLLEKNVDSKLYVQNKSSDDYSVLSQSAFNKKIINRLRPTLDSIPVKLYKNKDENLFSTSYLPFSSVVNKIIEINPDIVHLHWVCHGMISIADLAKIKKPIVWSLHDNWAFTGGCHIMWDCTRYKNSCGRCPRLGSERENDLSRRIFERKMKSFPKLDNLTIVGVSEWISECSSQSALFKRRRVVTLPNPLDTDKYKPFNQIEARILWNLPADKKLVLFGANSATADRNKGYIELCDSLKKLKSKNVELVVFGSSKPNDDINLGFKIHYLGHIHDDVSLVTIYSACDVMVVPSLQEAFGQTASESMSCGTPVVAFAHTGLLDIVDHKINGYLANPYDSTDMARGIDWILNNNNYDELSTDSRNKVSRTFDRMIVADKFIELYREILND